MTKIAVFASGQGSNLQAIIDSVNTKRIAGEIVLVVSSSPDAGALARAKAAGIRALCVRPKDFSSSEDFDGQLVKICEEAGAELVCLAGFMFKLGKRFLESFPDRILNIHPALLPLFGGKGMYGMHVHEAVLKSGVRVSGCTVHFVNEDYDAGKIILQSAVPVLAGDTPETLAARVSIQEHRMYPQAVGLFCGNRLKISHSGVKILPPPDMNMQAIKRVLISVSDKTGVRDFAAGLVKMGVEIVSTSGTAKILEKAGICVRPLESMTGFPEMLSGRVKTLHPMVHGAILFRRNDPSHIEDVGRLGIEPIDLVVVNLYPFAKTLARSTSAYSQEVIEQIDIGGVALIRAAAKNFQDVAVAVAPSDYPQILKEMTGSKGRISIETRRSLAMSAFKHTAEYDADIHNAFDNWQSDAVPNPSRLTPHASVSTEFPPVLNVSLRKVDDLRYGENPHQKAALYSRKEAGDKGVLRQLHGKPLSYNNMLDAEGTWEAVSEFEKPAVVVFKHVTPCGMATGDTILEAFNRAWECDPVSAFGGVIALNRELDSDIAGILSKRFVEVITAPAYEPEALSILKKKLKLRLIERQSPPSGAFTLRSVGDSVLVSEPDRILLAGTWKIVSKRKPSRDEEEALRFAWAASKYVRSNAIVLANKYATVGMGAGQMSRVDSVHMAGVKYKDYLKNSKPALPLVMASDAFFPFRDAVDNAAGLGVTAVIEPGGSIRDKDAIASADEHDMAMVFTGIRHFRH